MGLDISGRGLLARLQAARPPMKRGIHRCADELIVEVNMHLLKGFRGSCKLRRVNVLFIIFDNVVRLNYRLRELF